MPRKAPYDKAAVTKTLGLLLPYQRRFHEDQNRCKLVEKSRQIGVTLFCFTLGAVLDGCINGGQWHYFSAGERQAKAAIEDCHTHCRAIAAAYKTVEEEVLFDDDRYYKALEIRFPGGGRITGLPANPATVRGARGNVVLDEMAWQKDAAGIWRAAAPIAAHKQYKLWVGSTPNGKGGKYWQLCTDPKLNKVFSRHKITIYDAVKDGLPINIEELRQIIGDDEDWAQEFCCEFLDSNLAWIPFDLIDACTDETQATMELPEGFQPVGRCFKGIDIGRTRNLTVDYIAEEIGEILFQRQCKALDNVPFDDQEAEFNSTMELVERCCIDKGLMGMPLWEHLDRRWGDSRIEGVQFGPAIMEDMAAHLKERYEQRRIVIPYDLELRRDIHSIKRKLSGGSAKFAPDKADSKKSHADRFWAQALAVRAAGQAQESFTYRSVEKMATTGLGAAAGLSMNGRSGLSDADKFRTRPGAPSNFRREAY